MSLIRIWWTGVQSLVVALLAAAPAAALAQAAGQMLVSVGEVRLVGADGVQRTAERGAEVREGDQVLTGAGSLAQIRMRDGTLLSVRADSDFRIERYAYAGSDDTNASLFMSIVKGGLRSLTGAIGNLNRAGYRITTPTATVGIRGTDHETVFVPPNLPAPPVPPGTYDRVYAGQTIMQTAGQQVLINPNQVGFAPPAGAPPVILPAIPPIFSAAPQAPPRMVRETPGSAPRETDAAKAEGPAREGGPAVRVAPGALTPLQSPPTTVAPATVDPSSIGTIEPARTLSPTLIQQPTTTIAPTTTTIQQAPTTTISPTLIQPAPTTTVAPTAIQQPTTTISPTLIQPAPTTAPTTSPTLIQQAPAIQSSPTLTAPLIRP